jgi:ribosomal protein S18 acetylase RimI-like enzyme
VAQARGAPGVNIRAGTAADVEALLDLWRRADAAPSVTDTSEDLARVIDASSSTVLVAVNDDVVIGSVIATFDGWRGNYYRLAVDPAYRRRGIALQLVDAAREWLEAAGAKRVSALVEAHRPVAQAFWSRAGFAHHAGIMRYTKSL